MQKRSLGLLLVTALALSGCSVFKPSKGPKTPTLGERIPVLNFESRAEAEPELQDLAVVLPAQEVNAEWTQPGGSAAKAMGQLGIAQSKRVGGLGVRQRLKLVQWLAHREHRHSPDLARLVVLAGPTAVGKGTVSTYIRENYPEVHLSVSATTRAPRPGEVHGVNYYFVTDADFDRLIETGQMLETATVHNAFRYGTPRAPIEEALAAGKSVLLEIDLQGARSVRKVMPEAVLVFLLPPTWDELVRRLIDRGTEDSAEQQRRLGTAKMELAAQDEFDHRVVNSEVSTAAREVVDLMAIPKYNRSLTHG